MPEYMNHLFEKRSRILEMGCDIQRMEIDLDNSREQSQLIREAIDEKRHQLDKLQRRRRTSVTWEENDNDD